MKREIVYLLFGLFVLSGYAAIASTATVFSSAVATPSPPAARTATTGPRARPTFWSTGYHGGK